MVSSPASWRRCPPSPSPCFLWPLSRLRLENTPHPPGCSRYTPETQSAVQEFPRKSRERPPSRPPPPAHFPFRSHWVLKEIFLGTFTLRDHLATSQVVWVWGARARLCVCVCVHSSLGILEWQNPHSHILNFGGQDFLPCKDLQAAQLSSSVAAGWTIRAKRQTQKPSWSLRYPYTWATIPDAASGFSGGHLFPLWDFSDGIVTSHQHLWGEPSDRAVWHISFQNYLWDWTARTGRKGFIFKGTLVFIWQALFCYAQEERENLIFTRLESDSQDSCDSSFQNSSLCHNRANDVPEAKRIL